MTGLCQHKRLTLWKGGRGDFLYREKHSSEGWSSTFKKTMENERAGKGGGSRGVGEKTWEGGGEEAS